MSNVVTNPMKSHVDRFGTFLLDRIRGYADSTGVVTHKDGRRLRMPDVIEDGSETGGVLCAGKECGIFNIQLHLRWPRCRG